MSEVDSEELLSVEHKRKTIEKLIKYARQITRLSSGMESIREILKPSQAPQKRHFKFLSTLVSKLECHPSGELKDKLKKLDNTLEHEIERIIEISETSEEEFDRIAQASRSEIDSAYKALENEIDLFKRQSQMDLAIRICLHERGVILEAAELPISQEKLAYELDTLKNKEHQCRKQIITEIEHMIEDTEKALQVPDYPDDLKVYVKQISEDLRKDLDKIKSGVSLDHFSSVIEAIDMSRMGAVGAEDANEKKVPSVSSESQRKQDERGEQEDEDQQSNKALSLNRETQNASSRMGGIYRKFITWLGTPWAVTWRMIEVKQTKDEKKPR